MDAPLNLVLLRGRLSRPPELRELPSGTRLVAYEVTVERPGSRAESVPVTWFDPPRGATALDAGDAVVVVGRVRRRFFRAGGATGSRTEVVADRVVAGRRAAHARRLLGAALDGAATAVAD